MRKRRIAFLLAVVMFCSLILPAVAFAGMDKPRTGGGDNDYSGNPSTGGGTGGYTSTTGQNWRDTTSAQNAVQNDYNNWRNTTGGQGNYHWEGITDDGWGRYEVDTRGGGGSPSSGGGGWWHDYEFSDVPDCGIENVSLNVPDYAIREVVPLVVKKDQRALIFVNVENIGRADGKTDVTVKIGDETITMTEIEVPAGNHALSAGYFKPTAKGNPTIKVTVNPNHPTEVAPRTIYCNTCINECAEIRERYTNNKYEYDYSNNEWSGTMNISELPVDPSPEDLAPRPENATTFIADIPEPVVSPTGGTGTGDTDPVPRPGGTTPSSGDPYIGVDGVPQTIGNNRTETTWEDSKPTGADKTYSAKLDMTVKVLDRDRECTALKSGYGFSLQVTCKVTTDYPITERIEAPKKVLCYVPDWGDYTYAVPLKRTDNGGAYAKTTTWELPKNTASPTQAKRWYIPEWWSDGTDYKILVASKGTYTPGGELTSASVHTIRVDGNMYQDDYSIN